MLACSGVLALPPQGFVASRSGTELYSPSGILLSCIQQFVLTNPEYLDDGVPSCRALPPAPQSSPLLQQSQPILTTADLSSDVQWLVGRAGFVPRTHPVPPPVIGMSLKSFHPDAEI